MAEPAPEVVEVFLVALRPWLPANMDYQLTREAARAAAIAAQAVPVTVTKGQTIRIVPDRGPQREMRVSHVERYIITLADSEGRAELATEEADR